MIAIVDSVIHMSNIFNRDELTRVFDESKFDPKNFDKEALMIELFRFNSVIEEYGKLMSSDSPHITEFYMRRGFRNVFDLYHWYRKSMVCWNQLPEIRMIFSKHVQLLWSNIGDFFAIVIETKFIREAKEIYPLITEKHKNDSEFLCSLFYHICTEIFKQEEIIQFFLDHSKFFLE